ncbi:hypothetical protein H920_06015 [Fukomys damarensis]|uniref:Uncharacterized protein n=1 Tax=Fukomys damarensis TaxID=885580 RepID=A0A091DKF5_FUKDA|nr:hypothetical protein H920_06015 [Fukomys damarensis]
MSPGPQKLSEIFSALVLSVTMFLSLWLCRKQGACKAGSRCSTSNQNPVRQKINIAGPYSVGISDSQRSRTADELVPHSSGQLQNPGPGLHSQGDIIRLGRAWGRPPAPSSGAEPAVLASSSSPRGRPPQQIYGHHQGRSAAPARQASPSSPLFLSRHPPS